MHSKLVSACEKWNSVFGPILLITITHCFITSLFRLLGFYNSIVNEKQELEVWRQAIRIFFAVCTDKEGAAVLNTGSRQTFVRFSDSARPLSERSSRRREKAARGTWRCLCPGKSFRAPRHKPLFLIKARMSRLLIRALFWFKRRFILFAAGSRKNNFRPPACFPPKSCPDAPSQCPGQWKGPDRSCRGRCGRRPSDRNARISGANPGLQSAGRRYTP